ncbi:MAG: hypothetical protein H6747_05025 [Deltaproteobacteria bacterium]|nr:hypothetical protein [Deltaproteobacteria bacterium]
MPTPPNFAILDYEPTVAFTAVVASDGNIAAGTLVGLNASGEAVNANAVDDPEEDLVQALGIAAYAADVGEHVLILPMCTVYVSTALTFRGVTLYATDAGGYDETAPAAPGDLRQVVGYGSAQSSVLKFAIQPTPVVVP